MTIVLGKDNTVVDARNQARSEVNPDDIKGAIRRGAQDLSQKPLQKGDTWEQEVKVNLGRGQVFTSSGNTPTKGRLQVHGQLHAQGP